MPDNGELTVVEGGGVGKGEGGRGERVILTVVDPQKGYPVQVLCQLVVLKRGRS